MPILCPIGDALRNMPDQLCEFEKGKRLQESLGAAAIDGEAAEPGTRVPGSVSALRPLVLGR
jgi:hypothetical protein